MRGFQSRPILYSERCAHICLAPSQNSIVWQPKHVMFEPILNIFSDGITVRVFAWTSPEETAVVYNTLLVVYAKTSICNFRRVWTAFSGELPKVRTVLLVGSYSGQISPCRNLLTRRRLHVASLGMRDRQWNKLPAKFKTTWPHNQ